MRFKDFSHGPAILARGTALVLLAGLATGCSGDATRFTDLGLTTAATDNQRAILARAQQQPYPGEASGITTASVTPAPSYGGVSRGALPEVPAARAGVDNTMHTASHAAGNLAASGAAAASNAAMTATAATTATAAGAGGWNNAGGTRVTLAPGETLFSLSRRFGVPVNEIMKANGINDGNSVKAGARILIPTHAYSLNAPASAPDHDSKAARAVLPGPGGSREDSRAAGADTRADSSASGSYRVAAGDTLHSIARKHGVTTTAIQKANGLDSGLIRVGQVLAIPGRNGAAQSAMPAAQPAVAEKSDKLQAGAAVVRKVGEPLPQYTPPAKQKTEEVIQNARAEAPDSTGLGKMRWPARGRVITDFGAAVGGRKNDGIDIAVPEGTSVRAAENGVVIYAGDSLKDFGNTILLRHDNGLVTVYGHASQLKVQRGAVVKRGDEIALSGVTGAADVPKLHFEVRQNSVPVNPMTYLQ